MRAKVDKYGRILLPKDIRDELGLRENDELTIEVREDEIVIRVLRDNLEKRVDELVEYLRSHSPKPFVAEVEEGEKWVTRKHALEKIGLKE
ncbi:AbrB/MazE/SpoVT family DNA-binding domain-containing protein [Archaeoglobus sp.]